MNKNWKWIAACIIYGLLGFALGYVIDAGNKAQRLYSGPRIYKYYVDTCATYQPNSKNPKMDRIVVIGDGWVVYMTEYLFNNKKDSIINEAFKSIYGCK